MDAYTLNQPSVRVAGLTKIGGQTQQIMRPTGSVSRPSTPLQRYPAGLSAGMPPSTPSTPSPRRRGASDNYPVAHKIKPYDVSQSPVKTYNSGTKPRSTSACTNPAVRAVEYQARVRDPGSVCLTLSAEFVLTRPGTMPMMYPPSCGKNCLGDRSLETPAAPYQSTKPLDLHADMVNITPPAYGIDRKFCSVYVDFMNRRAMSPTFPIGVSMYGLITDPILSLEGSKDPVSQMGIPPSFDLEVKVNGYAIAQFPIITQCKHGEMTRRALAVTIARIYVKYMNPKARNGPIVHPGTVGLPALAKFEEMYILGVYQARARVGFSGVPFFQVDLLQVEKRHNKYSRN